tara:strand:- start:145 stop:333 length:189 start_codon:yes stop_codon:yes gene_type:complete
MAVTAAIADFAAECTLLACSSFAAFSFAAGSRLLATASGGLDTTAIGTFSGTGSGTEHYNIL